MILYCSCIHQAQDELHGKNMRVHNYARNAFGKRGGWRCTVCKKEKDGSVADKKESEGKK